MNNFKMLKWAVVGEINQNHNERLEGLRKAKTEEEFKEFMNRQGKDYKKNPRDKLRVYLEKKRLKEIDEILNQIKMVEEAEHFTGELVITIEWKKSRMWGSNPRAYTNYGFEGESISGCGYCKTSTATAQALNSHLPLLKMLYTKKERCLKEWINKGKKRIPNPHREGTIKPDLKGDFNRQFLGYGAGYNVLPSFEGGVGISSHESIIEGLNLKWKNVTSTSQTDVYLISI